MRISLTLKQHELTELSPLKAVCDGMNHLWGYSLLRRRFVCTACSVQMADALVQGAA
jgi:hypothetical protein